MRSVVRTAIAVAALLVPHLPALGAQAVPAEISAAVADHSRPQTDRDLDVLRRPAAMMAFAGLRSGDTVIEFTPGAGYLTRLLSKVVGPAGHVYSIQFSGTPRAQKAQMKAIADNPAYANVTVLDQDPTALKLPQSADMAWVSENYHDFKNPLPFLNGNPNWFSADTAVLNKAVFAALKPGGHYMINDYVALPGTGIPVTQTLHRIDPAIIRQEIIASGFVVEAQSDALSNPADDHVSDRGRQGADQAFFKFGKPR
jgi:predicted methyltransferase